MICTIIILFILAVNLGVELGKNGEPKNTRYNFWLTLVATVLNLLLYWGAGLFDNFK